MSIALQNAEREFIVAVHEAGHAVACVKLGVPFSLVSIGLARAGFGAGVDSEPIALPEADAEAWVPMELINCVERCRKQAIVCLAGRAAEERAADLGLTGGVGMGSDLKDLRDLRFFVRQILRIEQLLQHGSGRVGFTEQDLDTLPALVVKQIVELQTEAKGLVADHFSCIERVARELVTWNQLSAAELEKLVAAF